MRLYDPSVVGGVVYVGSGNSVYALNATDGTLLWNYATYSTVSYPAVANGAVYIGSMDDHVYALNATNGVQLWACSDINGFSNIAVARRRCILNGILLHSCFKRY